MSDHTRRDVLRATVATVVSAIAATGREMDGQTAARPNILWLVSEDNNPYLGCYGDKVAHTPNIDGLAKRGLLFKHVFSAAPVCAPSRFGILTGVHPESCAPANQMRATAALPPEIRTYPEYLRGGLRVLSSATVAEGAENQGHQRPSSATQDRIALPLRPRTWQCLDLRARFTPPASRSEVGDAQNANRFARRPLQQWPTLRWPRRRNRPTGRARRSAPDQVPARWT